MHLPNRVRNILNAIVATPTMEAQQGVVMGAGYQRFGKIIDPAFDLQMDYYLNDPHVRGHIDDLGESSVGHGFFLTAKNEDIVRRAEDWCETIDLDTKLQVMSKELWITGNSILEMVDPPPSELSKLVHLPISSFKRFLANEQGVVDSLTQRIEGVEKTLLYSKLVHFCWNRIDASIWGRGLLYSLVRKGVGYKWKDSAGTWHKDYRPSYMEIKEETEDAMRKVIIKNVPRFVYTFKGLADAKVKMHGQTIRGLRPDDDLIVGLPQQEKTSLEVTRVQIDPRSRLHPYFEHFLNGVYTGLETPSPKLFLEAGFTEASAKTAVEVKMQKIAAFRRFLKRNIESRILKPFIMQQMRWTRDILYKRAELRLHWNMEIIKPKIEDVIRLAEISAQTGVPYITPDDVRNMLGKMGFEFTKKGKEELEKLLKKVMVAQKRNFINPKQERREED